MVRSATKRETAQDETEREHDLSNFIHEQDDASLIAPPMERITRWAHVPCVAGAVFASTVANEL